MIAEFWSQMVAVVRIELVKTFFARRSLWIYLLALLPGTLFYGNSIYAHRENVRLSAIAAQHPVSQESLRVVMRSRPTAAQVVQKLGEPYRKDSRQFWGGRPPQQHERLLYFYTDGQVDAMLTFNDGNLIGATRRGGQSLPQALLTFASVFQLYFLRLAIFFGCAGIFTNLFRGEMLDKSLHFYLLSPVPRPVLVLGKYASGVFATSVIFAASTALQFYGLLRGFDSLTVQKYLQGGGWDQIAAYMSVAALACVAYGSIFLAFGLVARNPAIPAALLLLWESVNTFIPGSLKLASIVFYLQSLCPIEAPPDTSIPPLLRQLVSATDRVGIFTGLAALGSVALVVLFISGLRARNLEINYSTD